MQSHTRRAYLYERVSTIKQNAEMQHTANLAYAAANGLPINGQSDDTASGSLPWRERRIAAVFVAADKYTDLIVYELSRIGRDLIDTLEFLKEAIAHNITVHISRTGMRLSAGIDGKIMATVLGLCAEIEREFIRTRTRDALAERREKIRNDGGFTSASGAYRTALGRPKGATSASKLDAHAEAVTALLNAHAADALIARVHGVSRATVKRYREQRAKTQQRK